MVRAGEGAVIDEPDAGMVYVVDDDAGMRLALEGLIASTGLSTRCFADASSFLNVCRQDEMPACLVLDVRLPGLSGMDLLMASSRTGHSDLPPIVMMTGHGDIAMGVRAMKSGAVDFLSKPFRGPDLLAAIREALRRDRQRRLERTETHALAARYQQLTAREAEVVGAVAAGSLNKEIAAALSISEVTVKLHRARAMRKLGVFRLADLVRVIDRLERAGRGSVPNLSCRLQDRC